MRFQEDRSGDQVDLAPGAQFEVELAERAGTGFRWHLQSEVEPVCRLAEDVYQADATTYGGSGARILHFEAVQPGEVNIRLAYRRAWETNAAPARQFALTVRVA